MNRGDIRYYTFKQPDKRRPVLILSRDSIIPHLTELTVAPITSRIRGIPTEVVLTPADGVPTSCAINLDHLQTISKAKLGSLITRVKATHMEQVRAALLFALGFD